MLEIRHLRLIRAIAEEGGVTRAAERLHRTQSAVSHQLAELEQRLGVNLFNRVRRRLVITPEGRRLFELSEKILGEIAHVEREIRGNGQKRVSLRVCTETFTCYHWLASTLQAMQEDSGNIDIKIVLEASNDPISALMQGEIDLALIGSPLETDKLPSYPLFEDEWVVVLPPEHPLTRKEYIRASDLSDHILLTHIVPTRDVERLREWVAAEQAKMPKVRIVPLTETIVEMLVSGLGIALMSSWAVSRHVQEGRVVTRRFTRKGLREQWSLVHSPGLLDQSLFSRFVKLILQNRSFFLT